MWGSASPTPERGLGAVLFAVWLLVLTAATWALLRFPTAEPYAVEAVVLSFALLYGFGVWPVPPTAASIVAFGILAALIMYPREKAGELPPALLIEVVAPVALAGVVIFHVRRRDEAMRRARLLAEANRRRAAARELLGRMTSHELRTPLTIATGYIDQLLLNEPARQRRDDLCMVRDELDQLARVSERLVRAVALDLGAPEEVTEVGVLLDEVRRRWDVVVDRDFVVASDVQAVPVNADRLRAALDTLVENSVRYTGPGDRICLFSTAARGIVEVGVADAGTGLSGEMIGRINSGQGLPSGLDGSADGAEALSGRLQDMYSQTGFGLRLVAGIARSAGGRLVAARSDYGGARVALAIPTAIDPPASPAAVARVGAGRRPAI